MKLKSGCVWNTSDGRLMGFIDDGFDSDLLRDDFMSLINLDYSKQSNTSTEHNESKKDETPTTSFKTMAKYVNVFRLVLFNGISKNIAFFYNNGTLNSNQLLQQILHVYTMLSFCGIEIYGILSDAGVQQSWTFLFTARWEASWL